MLFHLCHVDGARLWANRLSPERKYCGLAMSGYPRLSLYPLEGVQQSGILPLFTGSYLWRCGSLGLRRHLARTLLPDFSFRPLLPREEARLPSASRCGRATRARRVLPGSGVRGGW